VDILNQVRLTEQVTELGAVNAGTIRHEESMKEVLSAQF